MIKEGNIDKIRIKPNGIDQEEFFELLHDLKDSKLEESILKKQVADLTKRVKNIALEEFKKLVVDQNTNSSFILESVIDGDIAETMFVPTDKYLKIDEKKYESLSNLYGSDVVSKDETYTFNPKMMDKHFDKISELIMNSDIPEKDKNDLILKTTSYSVNKGTINRLNEISDESGLDVSDILDDVQPVFQLKNVDIIKS